MKRPASNRRGSGRTGDVEHRRLGGVLLAIAAVWTALAGYVVHSQLPANALELPAQDALQLHVRQVAPQGWAFFTKSPRSTQLVVWRPDAAGAWERAMLAPHSEPRNLFGFNRRSRAQPVEMALLGNRAPAERWRECPDGNVPACLAAVAPGDVVPVDNPSPGPLLCGPVGLSRQEPLPWAWADAAEDTRMPARVLRLEVRC